MLITSAGVAIAGGIVCLDRIVLHALISRPLIAGPIIGALLHDPFIGLITGAFVELIWIDRVPIGGHIGPNESVVAIVIAAGSILAGQHLGHLSQSLFVFTFLLFLPLGYAGRKMEVLIRHSNNRLSQQVMEDARAGNVRGISRRHLAGLWKTFFGHVFLIFTALTAGTVIIRWLYPLLPPIALETLYYTYFIIPIVGISVALNTIKTRGVMPLFSGLFLIFAMIAHLL